jgi:hypothetical protein
METNVIQPAATPLEVPVIDPTAIFTLSTLKDLLGRLGISPSCAGREVRLGRMKVSKRGGKCLFLGSWLIEWLERGEAGRSRKRRA